MGRPTKDRSGGHIISEMPNYDILRTSLTVAQLDILDKIVRRIEANKIHLYYHKNDINGDIDMSKPMYIGLHANQIPFGCEMTVYKWYLNIVGVQELISSVRYCISNGGKRIFSDSYDLINYIGDGIIAKAPFFAKYIDKEYIIYVKDILYCNNDLYVFAVLDNVIIKRFKVHGRGRQMYFNFNDNRIKLSKLEYL